MASPLARRALFSVVTVATLLGLVEGGARVTGVLLVERQRAAGGSGEADAATSIVCVGDSWTWGYRVEPADAWPARLAAAVRAAGGPSVRVTNLGKPGASSLVAARALASALAASPADRVIALVGMNPDPLGDPRSGEVGALRRARPWLSRLATYRLLTQAVYRGSLASDALLHGEARGAEVKVVPGLVESKEDGARFAREQAAQLRKGLARLDEVAAAHGAELVVLNYALPPSLLADPSFHGGSINTQIRDAAEALRLPLVDVQAAYLARGVRGPEVVVGGAEGLRRGPPVGGGPLAGDPRAGGYELHPNAAGHAIYAETVAGWLVGE